MKSTSRKATERMLARTIATNRAQARLDAEVVDRDPSVKVSSATRTMLRNAGVLPARKKTAPRSASKRVIGGELNSRGEMVKPRPKLGSTDAGARKTIGTKKPSATERMLRAAGTIN